MYKLEANFINLPLWASSVLASPPRLGASPLCMSDVYKDADQMHRPEATFINLSLWASSVFGFATSPRGFAPLYIRCL